jgi:hypothetical protein
MNAQELTKVRELRTVYGRMMTNGYSHEHAVEMIVEANKATASDAVITRALWLDPSIPWCDPV